MTFQDFASAATGFALGLLGLVHLGEHVAKRGFGFGHLLVANGLEHEDREAIGTLANAVNTCRLKLGNLGDGHFGLGHL